MKKSMKTKKILVLFLAFVLLLMPMEAFAEEEESVPTQDIAITSLDSLDEAILTGQVFDVGMVSINDIILPDMLTGRDDFDSGITIFGVTWASADFDPDTAGSYAFNLVLPNGFIFIEGVTLPQIQITIEETEIQDDDVLTPMTKGNFNTADIEAMNAIITAHPELGWTLDAVVDDDVVPADWTGTTWSSAATNKRIARLDISNKNLTGILTVSGLSALTILDCSDNQLVGLDVSALSSLRTLYCQNNRLTDMDVSGCDALATLYCHSNELIGLDTLPQSLTLLSCYNNQLTNLDTSGLTKLNHLDFGSNKLTSVDLSDLSSLTQLHCSRNRLTALETLPLGLTILSCYDNLLTSLNVSGLSNLTHLDFGDNLLTGLDVSGLSALTELYCSNNQLTSLGTLPSGLVRLSCPGNQLTSLDVSGCTGLIRLDCYNNQLISLNVSYLSNLSSIYCWSNQLDNLDLTGLSALVNLYISDNPISLLIAPNGNMLNITKTNGVLMGIPNDPSPWSNYNFGYNISTGEITLTAISGIGRTFERWILPKGAVFTQGTTETSNPAYFKLSGTMAVTPVFEYDILSAPESYTGDMQDRVISVDGDIEYYSKTTVGGYKAPVTAESDNTVVVLPGDYLHTLANGNHDVRVLFTDGYATATLSVESIETPPPTSPTLPESPGSAVKHPPKTSDINNPAIWIALASMAGSTLLIMFLDGRRTKAISGEK